MFRFFNKKLVAEDNDIVAMIESTMFNIKDVNDEVFASKTMGNGVAFHVRKKAATICSPANGTLCMLFNTGHAFGIRMNNGVELLVHIGIDTVLSKGIGFKIKNRSQGDIVKAGDEIVDVDFELLSEDYDMPVLLIVTEKANTEIVFGEYGEYKKGNPLSSYRMKTQSS